tara:strand:- start:1937 stop:2764 length:828 start_codon:yes stop_codon:yes gene_type:complete
MFKGRTFTPAIHSERALVSFDFQVGPAKLKLHVEYQPVVRLNGARQEVCAYECLLRVQNNPTNHNTYSVIQAAERTGTMPVLDALIAREACQTLLRRPDLHLWLNLSQVTLCSSEALRLITGYIQSNGLEDKVTLEMTETVNGDEQLIRSNLQWLKERRVKVVLDDIEDMFAKVGLLATDLISGCKFSRQSLIALSCCSDRFDAVAARIEWCSKNDKTAVIEGIETESDLAVAFQLGADFGQGYLFWPAMPSEQLPVRGTLVDIELGNAVTASLG